MRTCMCSLAGTKQCELCTYRNWDIDIQNTGTQPLTWKSNHRVAKITEVELFRDDPQKAVQEERKRILGDLKLWRPVFYKDKVTKEDIKELKNIILDKLEEKKW